jgi:hypothetical protein
MQRSRSYLRFLLLALAVPLAFVLTSVSLHAQADTGSIQGTIKDPSGAVIPNAKVTLTNEGTNLALTQTAGADGTYIFTPVKIGIYSVTAEAAGFAKAVQPHITLEIQQQRVVDLTLKPGMVTQTIEVTAAPPPLQTQNASVGQVVSSRAVNQLPLNGRNFTFLAQLAAGVNTPQADTRGNAQSGAFSANGMRPAQNNYLLNGIDNNSDTVDFLNGTNYVVLPPVDAIQEFKVQTSDYSAQFGRAGGAILNAQIKSGTNSLHGTLWEFLRNDKLDARDFFEDVPGGIKGEYRQNQFGVALGGPIKKNKAFFFGDYEGLRVRQGTVFTNSVPTAAERDSNYADLSDLISLQPATAGSNQPHSDALGRTVPYGTIFDPATTRQVIAGSVDPVSGLTAPTSEHVPAGTVEYVRDPFGTCLPSTTTFTLAACGLNQLPTDRIDQNAVALLNLYPTPTNTNLFQNNTTDPLRNEHRNAFDIRVDINKGDKDQIFATFSYVDDPQFIPGPFAGIADGGAFQQGIQTANTILPALSWTHTLSPTTVNEARIGLNRIGTSRTGPVPNQLGLPAQYGIADIPQVALNGGLPAFGINGLNTLGSNNFLPSDEVTQTNQVTDNFTKTYGKHTFKAGIEYQRVKYSTLQPPWSHGQFNYDGVYTRSPGASSDSAGRGQFLLNPEASTVPGGIDYVGGSNQVFVSNIAQTDDGKNYWGSYIEDDWKVSPKLTLNLGVRWDWFGQTFEHYGAQANFIPAVGTPSASNQAQYLIPTKRQNDALSQSFLDLTAQDFIAIKYSNNDSLGESQKTNFGPRVGFAYQWMPKLVMRGGFGLFYNGFENRGYSPNIGENYPFQFGFNIGYANDHTPINAATYSSFAGTGCADFFVFESGFSCTPLQTDLVGASGLTLRGIQYKYQTPYTEGWNLTFQYELTPATTISLGYVGNSAHHIEVFPGSNNVNTIIPPSGNPKAVIAYPDFGQGNSYAATEGSSYYHSLQLQVERHLAKGLYFLANDTFSRTRSDAGDLLNGGVGEQYRCPTMPGCGIQFDYRDANFDIRNVFHLSGGWELPFGPGKPFAANAKGVEKQIVDGWSMQWILTAEGGQPATINCDTNPTNGMNCTALLLPGNRYTGKAPPDGMWNPATFTQPCNPDTGEPAGCVSLTGLGLLGGAPTQVRGPGITRLDYSLFKDFQVSERFRLQFRSEFFNILNHPTFMPPNLGGNGVIALSGSGDWLSSNFGKSGATRFPNQDARQIQFALKLYF